MSFPRKPRKLVSKQRFPHLARSAITPNNVITIELPAPLGRLDVDPRLRLVLAGAGDLVLPVYFAVVFGEEFLEHELVELVEDEADHAEVLAVDVGHEGAVHARDDRVVPPAPPAHRRRAHAAPPDLVDDARAPQLRHRRGPVDRRPRLLVQLVRGLEDFYGDPVLRKEEGEQ